MDRRTWLKIRKSGVGASEVAAILGINPFSSLLKVYADKVSLIPKSEPLSSVQEWGLRHEAAIAKAFEEKTNNEILQLNQDDRHGGPLWINRARDHELIIATTDARILSHDRNEQSCLQIKTAAAMKRKIWKEGVPLYIQVQVQQEMFVEDLDWMAVAVLIGGNEFMEFEVERNESFIQEAMIPAVERFWEKYIIPRRPPPADGSQASADAIKLLYPEESGETIYLPPNFVDLDAEREEIKKTMRELEERKRLLDNQFKSAIGNASEAVLEDGTTYTNKTVKRKGGTIAPSKSRQLNRRG